MASVQPDRRAPGGSSQGSSDSGEHNFDDRAPPKRTASKRTQRQSYVPPEYLAKSAEQPRGPTIHQAVSTAFLSTPAANNNSTMANEDLVNTIAQQVIQSLKASGIGMSPAPQPQEASAGAPPPPNHPRRPDTPPSPEKFELPKVDPTGSSFSDTKSTDGVTGENAPPRRATTRPTTPPTTARPKSVSRPPPPERALTDDRTPLEKMWQPLFDGIGKPTERLGQFLRGLAIHIIEDYEPQHSLVITPQKMMRFYDEVKMSNELHPWNEVFSGKVKHTELSHIYRDLDCEQHFVQATGAKNKPTVPALTPIGFETWMTKMILAHPELEFERFARAVLNMPINNADDPTFRFPKELPRRLFPQRSNIQARDDIDSSIYAGALEDYRKSPRQQAAQPPTKRTESIPPVPRTQTMPTPQTSTTSAQPRPSVTVPPVVPAPPVQPTSDRDPGYISAASSEAAIEDSPPNTTPKPIERQRKPYTAAPGGGKVLDDPAGHPIHPLDQQTRVGRSESVPQKPNGPPLASQRYMPTTEKLDEYGVSPRPRTNSLAAPPLSGGNRRRRSVSRSSDAYTRSGNSINAQQPPSFMHSPSAGNQDFPYEDNPLRPTFSADDRSRRYRYEEANRDHRDTRDNRDSRDMRDSRDFGPPPQPRVNFEDDPRRSRTYTDYLPPPPPNYR